MHTNLRITVLFLMLCLGAGAQSIYNPAMIGQPTRNQAVGKSILIPDSLIVGNVFRLTAGAANGKVLKSNATGYASWGDVPGTINYLYLNAKADTTYTFNGTVTSYNPAGINFTDTATYKVQQLIIAGNNQYITQYLNLTNGNFLFPGTNQYVTFVYKQN